VARSKRETGLTKRSPTETVRDPWSVKQHSLVSAFLVETNHTQTLKRRSTKTTQSFFRRFVQVSLHQRFLTTWLWLVRLLCLLAIHNHQVVGIDMAAENGECLNGDQTNPGNDDDLQYLFIIRHGDRWDYSNEDVCLTFESSFLQ
jgi:hypothetical protein